MKLFRLTITLLLLLSIVVGCQKTSDLFDQLSPEDEQALEGMGHAFEGALAFHDSLIWCVDTSQACADSILDLYENEIHEHIIEWEEFHAIYSHNNVSDDHHHGIETPHHHGNTGGHVEEDDGHNEEEEDNHGHSIESHHDMNQMTSDHTPYHSE